MNKHSGDDGLLAHAFLLPIGLADVNNVITYDEFSKTLMMVHNIFTFFLLSCRLTHALKQGHARQIRS